MGDAKAESPVALAERLREYAESRRFQVVPTVRKDCAEAADAIERLQADLDRAVEVMKPFADVLADVGESEVDEDFYRPMSPRYRKASPVMVGHLRAARSFIASRRGG
jgi:hypothetical protein